MLTHLRVQLLGGFRLTCAGALVEAVTSTIQQSLLAFLVLRRDAAPSRQQVAFCLWPDSPEAQAQANLRTLLVRLRRGWPDVDQFVEFTPRTIHWRPEAVLSFDVAEFEEAVNQAEELIRLGADPETARADLEKAVPLYRGDLLPACYDDWIVPERERLRQSLLRAIRELIELLEQQRDFIPALGHAQYLLQLDPLEETSYQLLMRLHALRGDRAGVVRTFETCAMVLKQELAIDPSPNTQEIYKNLLRLEVSAAPVNRLDFSRVANHNLPYALTSFIGREREIAELRRALLSPPAPEHAGQAFGMRLLTLTGAGGSGKTRLALRVAFEVVAQYPDGVWWIDLAPLADPWMVSRTVASVLGVQEQPDRSLSETLISALGSRRLLLILDNCEHLVSACATLASQFLSACPNLTILATSQEALSLAGEAVYPTPPLPFPLTSDMISVEQAGAVQLFVERAALVLPTFALRPDNQAAVVQVCRRLDGLPLAIELAAARVKVLSVDQIAARLDDRFNLLTSSDRTTLPRHQTLWAMVDWSHELLSEQEQFLLRRLSVFAGGFTLEAAEAVGGESSAPASSVLTPLSRLIDKSLVVAEEASGGAMRYQMLETVRQYALEKLGQANELLAVRERHANFFARMAQAADPHLQTAQRQGEWLARLESDRDNFRGALGWCLDSYNTETALGLGGHLGWFWVQRSEFIEGRQWLERALTLPNASQYPRVYGRALVFAGILAFLQTEEKEAKPWLEQALAVAQAHADRLTTADALNFLGLVALRERDIALARSRLEESQALFRELGEWAGYARTVWHLGFVMEHEADAAAVLTQYQQALALLREWGDPLRQSAVLRSIGWNQYELGDRARGRSSLQESLTLAQSIGHKAGIAHTLRAIIERIEADAERAVRLLMVVVSLYHSLGSTTYERAVLEKDLAQRRTQLDEATFAKACDEGRSLTTDQAIQDVLLVE